MKVSELMSTDVVTCKPETTCTEAAKTMANEDVGSLPVVANNELVGIITDRDIVLKCIAKGQHCDNTPVSTCMTRDPVTCGPETDAHEAARTMSEQQIRRLPVVDHGRLVGICTLGDMAVIEIHVDEAGEALHGISRQTTVH
jgi:CBS domain-containing protein